MHNPIQDPPLGLVVEDELAERGAVELAGGEEDPVAERVVKRGERVGAWRDCLAGEEVEVDEREGEGRGGELAGDCRFAWEGTGVSWEFGVGCGEERGFGVGGRGGSGSGRGRESELCLPEAIPPVSPTTVRG